MTSLPERAVPLWRTVTLALLLALLASCGPGTGGTGTGPVSFAGDAGATAVTGASGTPAPGLPCTRCTRIELRLDQGQIELRLPCGRFVFTGGWNPDATQLSLPGTIEPTTAGAPAGAPATLHLQFGADGVRSAQVVVSLVDATGAPLASATLLRRDSPLPDTCP